MRKIKNKKNLLFLILGVSLFLTNCTASRSAMGLAEGEANFSFIAPFAASFRVGVTDNIEGRIMFQGATKLQSDIFFHTHYNSNQFNYGISLGSRFDHRIFGKKSDDKPSYNYTITASKRIKRFTPYISFSYDTDKEIGRLITLGSEYYMYKSDVSSFKLTLYPEIIYFLDPKCGNFKGCYDEGENLRFGWTLGVGVTFGIF